MPAAKRARPSRRAAAKPSSIDDILAEAENPAYVRVTTARVLLRQDLLAEHERLDAELNAAIVADGLPNGDLGRLPQAPLLAEQLVELEAEIDAAKVEFRFRAVGKRAWADLLAQHPPTKDQQRTGIDHNPETFPVAAIAASCVEPELTVADAERLERALNASQFDLLWAKCIDANIRGLTDPKSVAAGLTLRASALFGSSATAAVEQSLAASSSDE